MHLTLFFARFHWLFPATWTAVDQSDFFKIHLFINHRLIWTIDAVAHFRQELSFKYYSFCPVPATVQSPHSVITVNESSPVIMTCIALGRPVPSLTWKKGGNVLTTNSRVNITGSQPQQYPTTGLTGITSDMRVDRADFSDRGVYDCIASTGKPVIPFSATHKIELIVNGRLSVRQHCTTRRNKSFSFQLPH